MDEHWLFFRLYCSLLGHVGKNIRYKWIAKIIPDSWFACHISSGFTVIGGKGDLLNLAPHSDINCRRTPTILCSISSLAWKGGCLACSLEANLLFVNLLKCRLSLLHSPHLLTTEVAIFPRRGQGDLHYTGKLNTCLEDSWTN